MRLRFKDPANPVRYALGRDLIPHPNNWRTHPPEQLAAVRTLVSTLGFADAVKVVELGPGKYQIVDGHARVEVLPDEQIPILVLDLTPDEAKQLLATYDPLGAMAGKDPEKLAGLLSDLKAVGDGLAGLVWPDYVIDPLMSATWTPPAVAALPTKEPAAPAPAPPGSPDPAEGDLFVIRLSPAEAGVWRTVVQLARQDIPAITEGGVLMELVKLYEQASGNRVLPQDQTEDAR